MKNPDIFTACMRRLLLGLLCMYLSACASLPPGPSTQCHIQSMPLALESTSPLTKADELTPAASSCFVRPGGTLQAMVLSGGGADAAFGAGFITGLLKRGQLVGDAAPCYLTGVSAGAILAPFVYLATAQDPQVRQRYQTQLAQLFQGIDDKRVLALNAPWRLLRDKSVYRSDLIFDEINRQLTPTLIQDLAQEYQRSGRIILIGAINIYNGQFELIDLTAQFQQAARQPSHQACLVNSIRASASIPVVFEPVSMLASHVRGGEIERKLYIDGGIRYPLFLHASLLNALNVQHKAVTVMTIINHPGVAQTLNAEKPLLSALGWRPYMNMIGEVSRNQRMSDAAFMVANELEKYHYQGLWANGQVASACIARKPASKIFDADYQQCLFDAGQQQAASPQPWAAAPILPAMH